MKKKLTMVLSVAMIAVMIISGTMAYLQDTDSDVNVMTLGNVKITQNEQQRVEKDGEFTNELEEFEQGKILMPVTYPGNRTADDVTIGDYTLTLSDDEANYVDKIISVTNDGKSDAFVRTLVAVPTGGSAWESIPVSANNCWLHWNIPADYSNYWTLNSNAVFSEINGQGYYIWEFVHKDAVESGKTTFPMVRGFYMDKRVDNDDNGFYMTYEGGNVKRIDDIKFGDTVDILVVSQAVQTAGFADAQSALDEAFGDITTENHPWVDTEATGTIVTTVDELKAALAAGGKITLGEDLTLDAHETLVIPEGVKVTLDLNRTTLTNSVVGGAALENSGELTLEGGSLVNGVNNTKASHTIVNKGTLIIEDGTYGTDDTAGAAVVNYGTTTINGGTFASKQENSKGDGLCAYAFINQSGTMTINNATLNGQTHGLFGAYGGEIIVQDGSYTLDGNDGLGCYVVYATGEGKVNLNGGTINTNSPRSDRVFFVYDNGNYFNADAVATGKVVVNGATIYLNSVEQTY